MTDAEWLVDGLLRKVHRVRWSPRFGLIAPPLIPPLASWALQRQVALRLGEELADGLAELWEAGWQPVDLHRFAVRNLDRHSVGLLGDLAVEQLATYPRLRVDTTWWNQLDALGWTRWWTTGDGVIVARLAQEASGAVPPSETGRDDDVPTSHDHFEGLCRSVAAILGLFQRAPHVQAIGPPPGDYDAVLVDLNGGGARIGPGDKIVHRVGIDPPYERPKATLLSRIAAAHRCRSLWNEELGAATVAGSPSDLLIVQELYERLLHHALAAMRSPSVATGRPSRTKGFRASFLTAYSQRIGARLSGEPGPWPSGSRARSRSGLVVAESQPPGGSDPRGWTHGLVAADRVDLAWSKPVRQA